SPRTRRGGVRYRVRQHDFRIVAKLKDKAVVNLVPCHCHRGGFSSHHWAQILKTEQRTSGTIRTCTLHHKNLRPEDILWVQRVREPHDIDVGADIIEVTPGDRSTCIEKVAKQFCPGSAGGAAVHASRYFKIAHKNCGLNRCNRVGIGELQERTVEAAPAVRVRIPIISDSHSQTVGLDFADVFATRIVPGLVYHPLLRGYEPRVEVVVEYELCPGRNADQHQEKNAAK